MVLIMKQINNIKFYDAKDGEVRVVFPDGREDYMLEKDAKLYYSKLYAAKMVDKLVIACLKECGLTVDNAHLSSYEQLNQFQTKFKEVLRQNLLSVTVKGDLRFLHINLQTIALLVWMPCMICESVMIARYYVHVSGA